MLMLLLTLTKYASQGREQEEQKRKSRWPKKIASMTATTSLLSSMFISIGLYIVLLVERKLQEVHLGSIVFLLSFIAIIEPIVSPTKRGLYTYVHLRTMYIKTERWNKDGNFAFALVK